MKHTKVSENSYFNFVPSLENTVLDEHKTLTLPSPARGRGFTLGCPLDRKVPSPILMLIVTHNPYGWRLEGLVR